MIDRWSEKYSDPHGFIAEQGSDEFRHRFGGTSWHVKDEDQACGGPVLLLTLDLHDPKLAPVFVEGITELPLCSYINGSSWSRRQIYQVNPANQQVMLIEREENDPECDPEADIPNPLPETRIRLRSMKQSEYPINYELYSEAFDNFAGGESFIRILGTPLFMSVFTVTCDCGRLMDYIASVGYQSPNSGSGFVDKKPFFIGEGYLYFFLCRSCLRIQVDSQGT